MLCVLQSKCHDDCNIFGHDHVPMSARRISIWHKRYLRLVHHKERAKALGVDRTQQIEETNAVVGKVLCRCNQSEGAAKLGCETLLCNCVDKSMANIVFGLF